jgi:ribonuclease R
MKGSKPRETRDRPKVVLANPDKKKKEHKGEDRQNSDKKPKKKRKFYDNVPKAKRKSGKRK